MVPFAEIVRTASEELYLPNRVKPLAQVSEKALELDEALQRWQQSLPPHLRADQQSLKDPEWVSKQSVVLRLSMCRLLPVAG